MRMDLRNDERRLRMRCCPSCWLLRRALRRRSLPSSAGLPFTSASGGTSPSDSDSESLLDGSRSSVSASAAPLATWRDESGDH